MIVEGKIIDLSRREIYSGSIEVEDGRISAISQHSTTAQGYIMLGFVDAHIHIESSLLTPTNFSNMVVCRGTVGVVTDPHEIANVMGCRGVEFMMEDSKQAAIRCHFTIPSSVPATPFDSTGGSITARDVERMARSGQFVALSEMMNLYGVISRDAEIMAKIDAAHKAGIAIDGHAPMHSGDDLTQYISYGITTDHECMTLAEAQEKIDRGMKILIREGSAAKNYEALRSLIASSPSSIMFCTDDSHPDEMLSQGHIDKIVRRAVADGYDLFDVLQIASKSPIDHYRLDQGDLSVGSRADFIVVDDLKDFKVQQVYIGGELRYSRSAAPSPVKEKNYKRLPINNFNHEPIALEELRKEVSEEITIIGVVPNEIVTLEERYTPKSPMENLECDTECDLQKIVYVNRYQNLPPVVAFCRGFGLTHGAIASSVSHDSHNIIAVGCSDIEIADAINAIIDSKGGLSISCDGVRYSLPLPIAGIMSDRCGEVVAAEYSSLQSVAKAMGCALPSPFMTLSFLSLVVIPEIKIGERGLFSYSKFDWVS